MRLATLTALLVLALLAIPLGDIVFVTPDAASGSVTPVAAPAAMDRGPSTVTPGVATATMDRGPGTVPPGAAPAAMDRGPSSAEQPGSRPIAATAAAGMTSSQPLELVTILPNAEPIPQSPRPLTRAEALASILRSAEFQDTVPPLARLYFATFGRYPDYEGLNYYTGVREGGVGLAEIAQDFANGREFEIRYGSLDNAEFVERLFVNVLGDAHQADVRAYWVSELDSGRMTRGQVIVDLSESGAFRERSDNRVFVSTAYSEIYRRTPDPNAYAQWVSMLDSGYSRRSFIDGLLAGR